MKQLMVVLGVVICALTFGAEELQEQAEEKLKAQGDGSVTKYCWCTDEKSTAVRGRFLKMKIIGFYQGKFFERIETIDKYSSASFCYRNMYGAPGVVIPPGCQ